MNRLGKIDVSNYNSKEGRMRSAYPIYAKVYEDSESAMEIFYNLASEHLSYSSTHRTSPVRSIIKAICKLDNGKYSTEAHLDKLQEMTFKYFLLIQDCKGLIEKQEEQMIRQDFTDHQDT